jgi:acyl-CoA thioester hydrolase
MISTDIQKRFADVDMLGHVNNVNLMHYFDVGKNDFFARVLGINSHLDGVGFITASVKVDYLVQTRLGDRSRVETSVEKIGNKSLTLFQRLVDCDTGVVNVELHAVMVAFDYAGQRSVELPDRWRTVLGE